MERVRVHLFISGRVQGVFYRATTRAEARRRGLSGWVRNLPDGRVEAEFEGPEASVRSLIDWAHEGPPMAAVTAVLVESTSPIGDAGFEIR